MNSISPIELLELYGTQNWSTLALIDVRSEGEFAVGSLPGFINLPILPNEQRAAVGTCYKQQGRDAAIDLGHKLVEPLRQEMILGWLRCINSSSQKKAVVHCWRGGLRSKIACEQMTRNGASVSHLSGGYKAFRRLLLAEIASPKDLLVLSGPTGTDKTSLLAEFSENSINLEAHAHHRGSSFGLALGAKQPSQQMFENAIGIEFAKRRGRCILLEDESKLIGHCYLGPALFGQMLVAPRVVVQVKKEERIQTIVEQYVLAPLRAGYTVEAVRTHLLGGLLRLKKNLGGMLYEQVRSILVQIPEAAFSDASQHYALIDLILSSYYDKAYAYSFSRVPKTVVFSGSRQECREFLREKFKQRAPF